MHICGLLGAFVKGFSLQNDDNCRQVRTIEDKYPKPPFESPHLEFLEIFKRDWTFQAKTWNFQARLNQRAEDGALDPWSLNLRFWGAPIFSPEAPKPLFWRVLERFGAKIWGAPNADPTTTDPTPHSRPSDWTFQAKTWIFSRFGPLVKLAPATWPAWMVWARDFDHPMIWPEAPQKKHQGCDPSRHCIGVSGPPPLTGVSGPSGPGTARKPHEGCRKVPENTRGRLKIRQKSGVVRCLPLEPCLGRKCYDSSPVKVILSYLVVNSTT